MLSPIQENLLEMLKWFHNFCEKNCIKYYIAGGTMIGAMRHGGFIPWDDDIDIVVPRNDYNRLLSIFNKKIDHYFLESPYTNNKDFLYSFSKLYDVNTTLTERLKKPCKRGIFIDIFPLDEIGNSYEEALKKLKKVDRKNMLLMTRTCSIRKNRKLYKNISILLMRLIPSFLFDEKKYSIKLDEYIQSISEDDSEYVANLMGSYREKEIVKKSYFGKPTLYSFENIKVYGPEKFDEYLTYIYGDWKVIPSESKRKTEHDFIEINLNKSYLEEK